MVSDWSLSTLDEAGIILIDCVHETPPDAGIGYPYIAIPQIKNGYIDFSANPRLIKYSDYKKWTIKANPQADDIVLSRRCNPGETAYVPKGVEFALGQNLVLLRSSGEKVYPPFLRWLVRGPEWWAQVSKYLNVGAVFDSLRCAEIPKFELSIPPLHEQKAIADILGSLDAKIELNQDMNKTLEAMAQALFKSWFVNFDPVIDNALAAGNPIPDELFDRAEQRKEIKKNDNNRAIRSLFPDEFEFNEEVGWIPKGWCVKRINDLVESVSITYPLKTVDKVIFLNTGDILDGKVLHQNYSDVSGLPGQAKKSIKKDDILYSEIRPKNKRYAYVNFEASNYVVSTKLMVLRSISNIKSIFSYFYLKQENIISNLQFMAEARSGTFPQITFDVLSKLTLTLPNETALIDYFTAQVLEPYHHKIYKNEENSEKLSELRDTLLPKLMSGEIRIPEAAALVENA